MLYLGVIQMFLDFIIFFSRVLENFITTVSNP